MREFGDLLVNRRQAGLNDVADIMVIQSTKRSLPSEHWTVDGVKLKPSAGISLIPNAFEQADRCCIHWLHHNVVAI